MKKFLFVLALCFLAVPAMTAQEDNVVKKEKMVREVHEFKMKYLAQEMELTEAQKKKFFELYEQMEQSKRKCFKEAFELKRHLKKEKEASDEDYQKVTQAFDKANANWAVEEKSYNEKFSEFLSQKQIYKMKEAEENYRTRLDEMRMVRKRENHKKQEVK